ncbi:putative dephospho-CoA kinase [Actinoplanes missouriensis 431]|uniref:Dephospho-CoA kinase n=1 Tax=Actinoplanes missouriensis (strain ATCC 14538 / DSM 43046 / CBS 188.64 / JCM 3121 / NBRC 102363 / NCIMB 12654 / NRRL B-3342 / UNCC 431) TaxID=512565 RepID=I0H1C1_ACTM4|nr:dephospho-CoA kinase [Actinoplanes missouriensis]BAL86808.1 putative dephospho-CoA kinase [Actinoplanes missouriensis 431]
MLRVGLTGGIGAGKSAVAQRFAERGAVIIDADVLSREVVEAGTEGLAEIVEAFGAGVLTAEGTLDRPALGAKVFGDEAARRTLEKIIHPRVRARTAELTLGAARDAIVVNDVPLLVEAGLAPSYHLVVVVLADRDLRVQRLTQLRGMSAAEAAARIGAQTDDEHRRATADAIVTNDADLATLHARVDELWRDRIVEFERNLRMGRSAPRNQNLRIVPFDPEWPARADRLIARIRHGLGDHIEVHHIGSTAVPGLPAKGVIDLMLSVRTLDEADALADRLAEIGFPRRPGEWFDNTRKVPGSTWPKRLHGCADPGYEVNLHVRVAGSPGWRFALLMRDHLRAVPEARDAYAAARAAWAVRFEDRAGYAEAKEPWFAQEAQAADDWALQTGWQPPV